MSKLTRHSWRRPISPWVWVLAALGAMLCAIGFVQIYWIEEVARAERESAAAAIRTAVARFTSDFDIEITRAYMAFQAPAESPDAAAALQYRLTQWRELSPWPDLVSSVKLLEVASQPTPGAGPRSPRLARTIQMDVEGMTDAQSFGLVVRFPTRAPLVQARDSRDVALGQTASAQIVLDMNYIGRQFIPELVARAFAERRNDVHILIASKADPNQVIWRSEPDANVLRRSADLSAPFFTLRPECFMSPPRTIGQGMGFGSVGSIEAPPATKSDDFFRRMIKRVSACDQELPGARFAGKWIIYAGYTAGSIDAVVTRFRTWSIGLSLGVLLILFLAGLLLVRSAERMRKLATLQMEFASTVSHELRTPLSAIGIAAANLSEGMIENREQAQRYGSLIGAQVRQLTSLISEVLLFSHSEASTEIPGVEVVNVEDVVHTALSNCAADLQAAGFRVEHDLHKTLPGIRANRHLITQCLINIIQNAIKYGRSGKFLCVETSASDADSLPGVRIDIVDHGPGIPPDELALIFKPFYRGREARSSKTSGLGLGLSIVKRIVEGHRGHIYAHSGPELHTRFTIWIPAAQGDMGAEG